MRILWHESWPAAPILSSTMFLLEPPRKRRTETEFQSSSGVHTMATSARSAFFFLNGESLDPLGNNFGLNGAVFHGHWRLCQFLIEQGADVNLALPDSGESPLHHALCTSERNGHDRVLRVLLSNGANPNCFCKPGAGTGGFMRDCRTRAETPLHRAAAFGTEETIQILLDAGANIDAKDMGGDTPLSWASWYLRPDAILRRLCYGEFRIHPQRRSMRECLQGEPYLEKVNGAGDRRS
jgi:hypothetical protein